MILQFFSRFHHTPLGWCKTLWNQDSGSGPFSVPAPSSSLQSFLTWAPLPHTPGAGWTLVETLSLSQSLSGCEVETCKMIGTKVDREKKGLGITVHCLFYR